MTDPILLADKGQRLRDLLLASGACGCQPTPEYAEYLNFMNEVTTEVATPEEKFLLWVRYEFRGTEYTVCEVCNAINEWDNTASLINEGKTEANLAPTTETG